MGLAGWGRKPSGGKWVRSVRGPVSPIAVCFLGAMARFPHYRYISTQRVFIAVACHFLVAKPKILKYAFVVFRTQTQTHSPNIDTRPSECVKDIHLVVPSLCLFLSYSYTILLSDRKREPVSRVLNINSLVGHVERQRGTEVREVPWSARVSLRWCCFSFRN